MSFVNDWDRIKQRFTALWEGEIIDRCCVSATAPLKPWEPVDLHIPDSAEDRVRYWTDGETILKRYRAVFENTFFGGEAFPLIWLNLGAAGHAGYFSNVLYRFEETVWFFPTIENLNDSMLEFDPNSFLYNKTLELARYFVDESKGESLVSMPDTAGNMDALAHLRGSDNLLIDMLTDKEAVVAVLEKVQAVWERVTREVYSIIQSNNDGGSTIGWLGSWAPGMHAQLQCDISVMISPPMFDTFAIPELKKQSEYLDYALYHLDGMEQIRHLDSILSIEGIKMIQWTRVAGQPSPVEFIPQLKKIQDAGKGLLLHVIPSEIETLMENLSSKGLFLVVTGSSREEAEEIIRKVEKLTRE